MEIGQWMMDHQWTVWLSVAVLLVLLEMFSLDLVFLMLSFGATGGLLVALVTDNIAVQVVAAIITSVLMLFLIRPTMVKRLHRGEDLTSGALGLVGQEGFVLEPMTSVQPGRVKIGGDEWTALPADDSIIPAGQKVIIVAITGATARVAIPDSKPEPNS